MALIGYQYAEDLTKHFSRRDIPVPVFGLAETIELPIQRHRFASQNICGIAVRQHDRYIIAVNSAHYISRQKFSAAHELGHCLCHLEQGTRDVFGCTGNLLVSESLYERQANAFAAELLMPRRFVLAAVAEGCDTVSSLARMFGVSREATHWRLHTLKIHHDMGRDRIALPGHATVTARKASSQ